MCQAMIQGKNINIQLYKIQSKYIGKIRKRLFSIEFLKVSKWIIFVCFILSFTLIALVFICAIIYTVYD